MNYRKIFLNRINPLYAELLGKKELSGIDTWKLHHIIGLNHFMFFPLSTPAKKIIDDREELSLRKFYVQLHNQVNLKRKQDMAKRFRK